MLYLLYMKKIYIASDHAGFNYKKALISYIEQYLSSYKIIDLGPFVYASDDDYPDFAMPLAQKVVAEDERGILICNNGIGVCIAANKVKGARAGIGYNRFAAQTMKQDDHTNILCLASGELTQIQMFGIVRDWLETPFSRAPRHKRRIKKITDYEQKK